MRRWTDIAHQGVVSGNTFALTIVLAHAMTPLTFGYFATGFAAVSVALGINRSTVTDPIVIATAGKSSRDVAQLFRARSRPWVVTTSSATVAAVLACVLLSQWELMVAAAALPVYATSEVVRFLNLALARRAPAVIADGVLLGFTTLGGVACLLGGLGAGWYLLIAWGLGPAVGLIVSFPRNMFGSQSGPVVEFDRKLPRYLLIDFLAQAGVSQVSLVVLAIIVSVSSIGDLRLTQTVFGFSTVAIQATTSLGLASAVMAKSQGRLTFGKHTRAAGLTALLVATTNLGAVMAVPDSVLAFATGSHASEVRGLAFLVFLSLSSQAVTVIPMLRLRALGMLETVVSIRRISALPQLLLPIAACLMWGISGYLLVASTVTLAIGAAAHVKSRRALAGMMGAPAPVNP